MERRRTPKSSSAQEVTAECNPESLDEEKARALLELGVRRLSIGFQSLSDETLASFGRV
ncbi:MAG TPA: radical SAM protein, partial [Planctomycetota bacterium]|nr:radical SAM protein [Planctomycetota bacterium]